MSEDKHSRRSAAERFARIDELFNELIELDGPERAARLEALRRAEPDVFPDLPELLEERVSHVVRDLDEVSQEAQRRLRSMDVDGEAARRHIGDYRLVRRLGRGGMGEVWEAEQREPVRRRVALKVLRPDRLSESFLSRFRVEQQALALMDHPNIASAYDAGVTDAGEPWFAMEFIEGVALTTFCDQQRLGVKERLALFVELCSAVQHAHRRGVVHRDLKPSNVLVSLGERHHEDESSEPARLKVIDFGIAKSLEPEAAEDGETLVGDVLGTPAYMSPEQAGHDRGIIDTRTDVYALGVLLFELLAGEVPLSGSELQRAGLDEMRRQIRENETPLASSRLASSSHEDTTEIARRRSTEPSSLIREIRGDLDWIIAKALAKQRDARYESPAALKDEIDRYLNDQPILAGPPTLRYRAGKFLRRNRVAVLAAATMLTALCVAVAGLTVGLVRAQRAEATTAREAQVTGAVLKFMTEVLGESAREAGQGKTLTPAELFSRAEQTLERDPPDDPTVHGAVLSHIGIFYLVDLEDYLRAEQLLDRAVEKLEGGTHADASLSTARYWQGFIRRTQGDLDAAQQYLDEALRHWRASKGAGDDATPAMILSEQALVLAARGEFEEGLVLADQAVERMLQSKGPNHRDTLAQQIIRNSLVGDLGRYGEAIEDLAPLLEVAERNEHWQLASEINNNLGAWRFRTGELSKAYQRFQAAFDINTERLGTDPRRLGVQQSNLGMIAARRGDFERAAELLRGVLETQRQSVGERSVTTLISQQILGEILLRSGQLDESRQVLEAVLPLTYDAEGLDPPVGPFRAERNLAQIEIWQAQEANARRRLDRAVAHEKWSELAPVQRCELLILRASLDRDRAGMERLAAAENACGEAWAHPAVRYQVARFHAQRGESDEALATLEALPKAQFIDAWIAQDPALSSLLGEPRFQAFVAEITPR
ncbi:MAG: protein kinase [Acidobacteriota bacterium]